MTLESNFGEKASENDTLQARKSSYQAWKCVSLASSLLALVMISSKYYETSTDLSLLLGVSRLLRAEAAFAASNHSAGKRPAISWPPVPVELLLPSANESNLASLDSVASNETMLMSHLHFSLGRELTGDQLLRQEVDAFLAEFRSAKSTLGLTSALISLYILSWILMSIAINDTRISNDVSLRNILLLCVFGALDVAASLGFCMVRLIMFSVKNRSFVGQIMATSGLRDASVRLSSDQLTAFTALRLISMRSCAAYMDLYASFLVLLLTLLRLYAALQALKYYRRLKRQSAAGGGLAGHTWLGAHQKLHFEAGSPAASQALWANLYAGLTQNASHQSAPLPNFRSLGAGARVADRLNPLAPIFQLQAAPLTPAPAAHLLEGQLEQEALLKRQRRAARQGQLQEPLQVQAEPATAIKKVKRSRSEESTAPRTVSAATMPNRKSSKHEMPDLLVLDEQRLLQKAGKARVSRLLEPVGTLSRGSATGGGGGGGGGLAYALIDPALPANAGSVASKRRKSRLVVTSSEPTSGAEFDKRVSGKYRLVAKYRHQRAAEQRHTDSSSSSSAAESAGSSSLDSSSSFDAKLTGAGLRESEELTAQRVCRLFSAGKGSVLKKYYYG